LEESTKHVAVYGERDTTRERQIIIEDEPVDFVIIKHRSKASETTEVNNLPVTTTFEPSSHQTESTY
jgi:hypothetical protein